MSWQIKNFVVLMSLVAGCGHQELRPTPPRTTYPYPTRGYEVVTLSDGRRSTSTTYSRAKAWVEALCDSSSVPAPERIFILRLGAKPYAGIFQYHEGVTIDELLTTWPDLNSARLAEVFRVAPPVPALLVPLHHAEQKLERLERQDVIWFHDSEIVVH